jgi:hypothetical protein
MSAPCRTPRSLVDRTLDTQFSGEGSVERHGGVGGLEGQHKEKIYQNKTDKGYLDLKIKKGPKDGRKCTELHGCLLVGKR